VKETTLPTKYEHGFLDRIDGRSQIAKSLRAAYTEILTDIGEPDASHIKRSLVERYCWLESILRGIERRFTVAGREEAAELLGRWVQGCNSMLGLAKTLGIDRRARKVESLRSYVERKARRASE
jgi:hypothetical protein